MPCIQWGTLSDKYPKQELEEVRISAIYTMGDA